MVRTQEEIMNMVRDRVGDDVSDEAIAFVQDISDTINSMNNGDNGTTWREKFENNDREWRQKYRDAFFGHKEEIDDDPPDDPPKLTFESLFEEK